MGGGSNILPFLRPNQLSLNLFPKTTGILGMEFVPFVIIYIKTKKMCDDFPPIVSLCDHMLFDFYPKLRLAQKANYHYTQHKTMKECPETLTQVGAVNLHHKLGNWTSPRH